MSKYQRIAQRFIKDIQSGVLPPGSRMPSLRQLSQLHSVSLTTAVSCYQELESMGWVESRPQAGFFVKGHGATLQTPTWASFQSQVQTPSTPQPSSPLSGPLGMSRLELDDSAVEQLNKSFRRGIRLSQPSLGEYPAPQGELRLRNALAEHFSANGWQLSSSDLLITHGCLDAVRKALEATTQPGDSVAISSPCYNGLLTLLSELKRNIVEIPSHQDGVDLTQLEQHLKTNKIQAGLFCTTYMNPQGITMSTKQKQRLAELANQYQVPIIEDDIYLELGHQSEAMLPASYFDTDGYMIWCGSVSKTLSPSLRLGWCRPGRYLASMLGKDYGVAVAMQYALADFIQSGHYGKHLKRAQQRLNVTKQRYLNYLATALPANARVSQPSGGLVLWIQIPGLDAPTLMADAKQQKLDVRGGHQFTASTRYRDCLRINIGYEFDKVASQLACLMTLIEQHIGAR
ncbi:transcriptional regulator, GntR family [Vibrio xiamenensis]|uniref:Transcriptional regulator, GntR family n=1 Tax=Vibrio xiamenensis TaxID=861298 RepID=A0A1G8HK65_9VIBR|nr:PLP-dependent aminotransferase family protein [Vibrio xiamenensis]SDI06901.1 transcriptional regulator, GntR family [Vibrio xiamenensis]